MTLSSSLVGQAQQDTFVYYNPSDSTYTFEDWKAHWMQKVIEEHKIQKDEIWELYPYKDLYDQNIDYIQSLESQVRVLDSLNVNLESKMDIIQKLYEGCLVLKTAAEEKVMPQGSETIQELSKEVLKQKKRKRFFQGTTIGAVALAIVEAFIIVVIAY